MNTLFLFLFLASPFFAVAALIKPSFFNNILKSSLSRFKLFLVFIVLGFFFIVAFAVTSDPSNTKPTPTLSPEIEEVIETPPEQTDSPDKSPEVSGIQDEVTPSPTPTSTPKQILYTATPKPTITTYKTPIPNTPSYVCNCSKTCSNMSSCAEAQYQLNTCGCTIRDADKDGIACDADCQ